jgi:hypothetical protein
LYPETVVIERITDSAGTEIAIILRCGVEIASHNGIGFVTHPDYSQQLALMRRPRGYIIAPHTHNRVERAVSYTREVVFVKSGRVCVHLYDDAQAHVTARTLQAGDWILLAAGGHGFEMIEDSELIEVKQGPYAGAADKTLIQGNPF